MFKPRQVSYRTLKGVLHNFLGTYTSRYSDWNGYWLFGFLVNDIERIDINLMYARFSEQDPRSILTAKQLAIRNFAEQGEKAGLDMSCLREAHLQIIKSPDPKPIFINGHICLAFLLKLEAKVVTNAGKDYQNELSLFVAPHDPKIERQSSRAI